MRDFAGYAVGFVFAAVFICAWIYCWARYGFLFGFGLGWLPAALLATICTVVVAASLSYLGLMH